MPTMFEKIWSRHVVADGPGGQTLLYVDRHLLHDGSRLPTQWRPARLAVCCKRLRLLERLAEVYA